MDNRCSPPGRISDYMIDEYVSLMERTDAIATEMLAHRAVPKVPVNAVKLISDTTTCRKAAEAYSAAFALPDSSRFVHVVKVGARYVVVDPALSASGYVLTTFDTLFTQPPLSTYGR
jgi:hypothetical protein